MKPHARAQTLTHTQLTVYITPHLVLRSGGYMHIFGTELVPNDHMIRTTELTLYKKNSAHHMNICP